LKYYYICSIIRTEQALIEKTIAGLQLTAVGSVQAQDRVRVFLNPGLLGDYFDQHGQQGMRVLFSGVDEALIKGWADGHGEVIDSKSFQQDETLTAVKDTLDEILESNSDGPLKNIRNEDWYSSSLVPASERRRFHWQNSIKRQYTTSTRPRLHAGINHTYQRLRQHYFIKNMSNVVKDYVSHCPSCQAVE
jgi:hypothetical protein